MWAMEKEVSDRTSPFMLCALPGPIFKCSSSFSGTSMAPTHEGLQLVEKGHFVQGPHVEEDHRAIAQDHGAALVADPQGQRRIGQELGLFQGAGLDTLADIERPDMDLADPLKGKSFAKRLLMRILGNEVRHNSL